jgi:carbamoyltransferase
MIIWGINDAAHDAALSVIEDGKILFAGHAERYSKRKNDWFLNDDIVKNAIEYGLPDQIAYYENSFLKRSRLLIRGGLGSLRPSFKKFVPDVPVKEFMHHESHAAAGYYTSSFDDAVVVVLDAIGEWETSSIWIGEGQSLKKIWSKKYPYSFGLFYSAFTHLLGLKPNQEEYIMMGMAAYGDSSKYFDKVNSYFADIGNQKYNFHKGITDWSDQILEQDKFDIAAAVQKVFLNRLLEFMSMAKKISGKNKLVYMGGVALNSSANTHLWDIFEDIWIMPNPGDAGSSLGSAAALYGSHLDWQGPYLGTNIPGKYPVDSVLESLISEKIGPIASGRSEFGPRALGNRSILADPRDPDIKDKVNLIKKRELFRPFAPIVLEEFANDWFEMPTQKMQYMQYTVKCKQPLVIPSVVHADGTSRVQTVSRTDHPGLYDLLKKWHSYSGVPVLLNTSLNIKNQPLLDSTDDIKIWELQYSQKIFS